MKKMTKELNRLLILLGYVFILLGPLIAVVARHCKNIKPSFIYSKHFKKPFKNFTKSNTHFKKQYWKGYGAISLQLNLLKEYYKQETLKNLLDKKVSVNFLITKYNKVSNLSNSFNTFSISIISIIVASSSIIASKPGPDAQGTLAILIFSLVMSFLVDNFLSYLFKSSVISDLEDHLIAIEETIASLNQIRCNLLDFNLDASIMRKMVSINSKIHN